MNVQIDNFRSFKNQSFTFSKINILIGENSSGKSSFLKFLLALKQTLVTRQGNLKLFGEEVDLGNYKEVIYHHQISNKLSFSFEFSTGYSDYYFDFIGQLIKEESSRPQFVEEVKNYLSDSINNSTRAEFILDENLENPSSAEVNFYNEHLGTLTIKHIMPSSTFNYIIEPKLGENLKCNITFTHKDTKYSFDNIDWRPEGFLSIIVSSSLKEACDKQQLHESIFYKISWMLVVQNFLSSKIQNLRFINPLNANPKRVHYLRDKGYNSIVDIEYIMNILGNEKIPKNTRDNILTKIREALKGFGLADNIELISSENTPVVEMRAMISNLSSNIMDVGYGVSLQLPILFQAVISEILGGETILIEQPEIHLHPRLQANFIDTLLKHGTKNKYFIETHSEHIIRKLQVLIKTKAYNLNSKDITIHYFKRESEKFVITPHSIDDNGKLTPNFPTGFFDNSYLLAKELF